MDKKPPDAHLICAYLSGQDRAFEKLFKRYEKPLFSFILRFVGNRENAEDLLQQTWLKVLKGLPKYEERGKFSSWLFGIANNCCIDCVRKKSVTKQDNFINPEKLNSLSSIDSNPDEMFVQNEQKVWLEKALTQLPPEQKQVVLLRLYGEMPFKEIARVLNSPLNTVLGRMHYAVQNLRKILKQQYGEVSRDVLS